MNIDTLLTFFIVVNTFASTGTVVAVIHLWKKLSKNSSKDDEVSTSENEVLEKNLNSRLRDLQTAQFSLRFSNLPNRDTGKKRQ